MNNNVIKLVFITNLKKKKKTIILVFVYDFRFQF